MTLSQKMAFPLVVSEEYGSPAYFEAVRHTQGPRCGACFHLRLSRAAQLAVKEGFAAFTSTLAISPNQKHGLIVEEGAAAGEAEGVQFLYEDLRKRYSDSRHITKPMDIYRQRYCGCTFSEWESFSGEG